MRPRRLIALLVAPVVVVACNSPSEPAGRASPDGPVADLQSTCEDANGQLSFSGFRWQTIAQADPDPKSISVYNRANTCVGLDGALTVRLDRTAQDGLWQGGELMLAAGASGTAVLGAGRYEYVLDAIDPSVAADAVLGLFSYPVRDPADTSDDGEHDAIDIEVTATRWGVPGAQNTQPGVLQYTDYLPAGSNPTNLSFRKAGVTFQGDLSQRTRHTYEWIDDGTVHFRSDVIADDGTVLRPIADAVIGAPVSRPNLRVLLNSWMFADPNERDRWILASGDRSCPRSPNSRSRGFPCGWWTYRILGVRLPIPIEAAPSIVVSGAAGERMEGQPLRVRVHDAAGVALVGASVVFTANGGGGISALGVPEARPDTELLTDKDGYASVIWTLGRPGPQNVTARVRNGTLPPVTFTGTAIEPQPDLTMPSFCGPPVSVTQGGQFTLSMQIANQGTAAVPGGAWLGRGWLSSDPNLDPNDVPVMGTTTVPAPAPGQVTPFSDRAVVPATVPPGDYYFIYKVDADNQIDESNEENNLAVYCSQVRVAPAAAGPVAVTDDFSSGLGKWVQATPSGSWTIDPDGHLVGEYDIACGSTTCTQSDLLLRDDLQPGNRDWDATVRFTSVRYPYSSAYDLTFAIAGFSLWDSANEKEAIDIGYSVRNVPMPTTLTTVQVDQQHYYPWSRTETVPEQSVPAWQPAGWNTATLQKRGSKYTVLLNGTPVHTFTSQLPQPPKVGFHIYGKMVVDDFSLTPVS